MNINSFPAMPPPRRLQRPLPLKLPEVLPVPIETPLTETPLTFEDLAHILPNITGFLSMREASVLRTVSRMFCDAVAKTPFANLETPIGRKCVPIGDSLRQWRQCFPNAVAANVSDRRDLVDADFVHFRGLLSLDISRFFHVTDAAFANLRGLRNLVMHGCSLGAITDAAFTNLRGIEVLDMFGCFNATITNAAFANLVGIDTLVLPNFCDKMTNAAFANLGGLRRLHCGRASHSMSDAAFNPLVHLEELDISGCASTGITSGVFSRLPSLKSFAVSGPQHPLIAAIRSKHVDEALRLVRTWGNVPDENATTPLQWASKYGNVPLVQALLDNGASPTTANIECDTPLHWAAQKGHQDVAHLLIQWGANPNALNKNRKTPRAYAIEAHKDATTKRNNSLKETLAEFIANIFPSAYTPSAYPPSAYTPSHSSYKRSSQ